MWEGGGGRGDGDNMEGGHGDRDGGEGGEQWKEGKGRTGRVRRDISVPLRIATKRGFWGIGRLKSMVVP